MKPIDLEKELKNTGLSAWLPFKRELNELEKLFEPRPFWNVNRDSGAYYDAVKAISNEAFTSIKENIERELNGQYNSK